jgi:hypothetical protein
MVINTIPLCAGVYPPEKKGKKWWRKVATHKNTFVASQWRSTGICLKLGRVSHSGQTTRHAFTVRWHLWALGSKLLKNLQLTAKVMPARHAATAKTNRGLLSSEYTPGGIYCKGQRPGGILNGQHFPAEEGLLLWQIFQKAGFFIFISWNIGFGTAFLPGNLEELISFFFIIIPPLQMLFCCHGRRCV